MIERPWQRHLELNMTQSKGCTYDLTCMQDRHVPSHAWEFLLACEEVVLGGGGAIKRHVHTVDTAASPWEAKLLIHLGQGEGKGEGLKVKAEGLGYGQGRAP